MNEHAFHKGYSLVVREGDDLERLLPAIAAAGFEGIEPTFVTGAIPSPEEHTSEARKLRGICDRLGLSIPSMRAGRVPWTTIPSNDAQARSAALDHMRLAFESLQIMGGTVLLVVPGDRVPDVDYHTHWRRVVEFGRAAREIAAEFDMKIGLENVEARFPVSELDWRALIDEIAGDRVGVYLDVGNVRWLGFGFPDQWIRTLGSRIVQVHFKDATYRLAGGTLHAEVRQLLEGDVDWQAVMRALNEIGYRGWISVEPESYRFLSERLPERLSADLDVLFKLDSGGPGR